MSNVAPLTVPTAAEVEGLVTTTVPVLPLWAASESGRSSTVIDQPAGTTPESVQVVPEWSLGGGVVCVTLLHAVGVRAMEPDVPVANCWE